MWRDLLCYEWALMMKYNAVINEAAQQTKRKGRLLCLQCPLALATHKHTHMHPHWCLHLHCPLEHRRDQQVQDCSRWGMVHEWSKFWMNEWKKRWEELSFRRIPPPESSFPLSCICIGCFPCSGSPHHAAVSKSVGATLPPISPSLLSSACLLTFCCCKEWLCLWMSLAAAECEWTMRGWEQAGSLAEWNSAVLKMEGWGWMETTGSRRVVVVFDGASWMENYKRADAKVLPCVRLGLACSHRHADQGGWCWKGCCFPSEPVGNLRWQATHAHRHTTLCKLVLRALNNNGVTRATRQVWSMGLALINRARRVCASVCLLCCNGSFFVLRLVDGILLSNFLQPVIICVCGHKLGEEEVVGFF